MIFQTNKFLFLPLFVVFVLAGCGGGGSSDQQSSSEVQQPSTTLNDNSSTALSMPTLEEETQTPLNEIESVK